jgi:hypothetical protein
MSYQERSTTVSLVSNILILGFYTVNWYRMYLEEGLNSTTIFRLWGIVIVAVIFFNIVGNILTNIVSSIIHAIKTNTQEIERFIADERDKLIGLKGERAAYIAFSMGVLLSMLTFVLGQPPLVMFSLIIFFSLTAQIIGDISKLYLYRRGF